MKKNFFPGEFTKILGTISLSIRDILGAILYDRQQNQVPESELVCIFAIDEIFIVL